MRIWWRWGAPNADVCKCPGTRRGSAIARQSSTWTSTQCRGLTSDSLGRGGRSRRRSSRSSVPQIPPGDLVLSFLGHCAPSSLFLYISMFVAFYFSLTRAAVPWTLWTVLWMCYYADVYIQLFMQKFTSSFSPGRWFINFLLGEGEVQFPGSQSCLGRPFSWGDYSFFIAESSGTTSVISLYFKLKMWSQKSRFTRGTAREAASSWIELLCLNIKNDPPYRWLASLSSKYIVQHISASFHTCYCQSQFRVMGAT